MRQLKNKNLEEFDQDLMEFEDCDNQAESEVENNNESGSDYEPNPVSHTTRKKGKERKRKSLANDEKAEEDKLFE